MYVKSTLRKSDLNPELRFEHYPEWQKGDLEDHHPRLKQHVLRAFQMTPYGNLIEAMDYATSFTLVLDPSLLEMKVCPHVTGGDTRVKSSFSVGN